MIQKRLGLNDELDYVLNPNDFYLQLRHRFKFNAGHHLIQHMPRIHI